VKIITLLSQGQGVYECDEDTLFYKGESLIFNAHGEYRITFDGHIILVEASGPWNKETILSYVEEIKTLQAKVSGSCLGIIYALKGESIVTPDAKVVLQKLQQWRVKEGYVCPTAFVFLDEEERAFYEALFRDIHKNSTMPPRFFTSVEQAKKCLMKIVVSGESLKQTLTKS
jgi:hypothetical protein